MIHPVSSPVFTTRPSRARAVKGALFGLVLGLAAAASVPAVAAGFGHGHHGHHGGMMGGPGGYMADPQHVDRMVEHMLRDLNASEQQRSQIRQIAQSAATELKAGRDAGRKLHEQMRGLFTQPNVDAAAIESLRQQSIAQMDANSRRMTQAMVDIARVLTPEQRAKLAERMAERQRRVEQRMQERQQRMQEQGPR